MTNRQPSCAWPHPVQQDILGFLETEAYRKVSERMRNVRFLEAGDRTLIAGAGADESVTFTMQDNGAIAAQPPNAITTGISPAKSSTSSFTAAWHGIIHQATILLNQEVETIVPPGDWMNEPDGVYSRTLTRLATAIAAGAGMGYVRQPHALGAYRIAQMAGPGNVSMTLKLFGARATIANLNTFIRSRENLTRAYEEAPNAAVAYARLSLNRPNGGLAPDPETIVRLIRDQFAASYQTTHQGEGDAAGPEDAWHAFLTLNAKFVRRLSEFNWQTFVRIAGHAALAQATPSYTACRTLLELPGLPRENPRLIRAYFRESARKGILQGRLAAQYQALCTPTHQDTAPLPDQWQQILHQTGLEGMDDDSLFLRIAPPPGRPDTLPERRQNRPARCPSPPETRPAAAHRKTGGRPARRSGTGPRRRHPEAPGRRRRAHRPNPRPHHRPAPRPRRTRPDHQPQRRRPDLHPGQRIRSPADQPARPGFADRFPAAAAHRPRRLRTMRQRAGR